MRGTHQSQDNSVDGDDVTLPDEITERLHTLVEMSLHGIRRGELRHQIVHKRAQMCRQTTRSYTLQNSASNTGIKRFGIIKLFSATQKNIMTTHQKTKTSIVLQPIPKCKCKCTRL